MRVLVTGVKGQLGYDVMRELEKRGHTGIGVDVEEMDITDAAKVDEVIKASDVETVIHCGCKLIATAHGESLEDILDQPFFYRLMSEKIFERYIILGKNDQAGYLEGVLDENGRICLKQ